MSSYVGSSAPLSGLARTAGKLFPVGSLGLYLRLAKPRLVSLLLLAAATGYVVSASGEVAPAKMAALLMAGALGAGGAAMINNYLERDLDARMGRTASRPLVTGRIRHPHRVLWWGLAFVTGGVLVALGVGPAVALAVALGALVYLVVYTVALKPRSHWSVVVGGLAGSMAVLAGWLTGGGLSLGAVLLALLLLTWQSAHFWPLALAREADYRRVGVPVLPRVVGPRRTACYTFIAALVTVAAALALGPAAGMGPLYFYGALVAALLWLAATAALLRRTDGPTAWRAFKASGLYLASLFLLMLADVLLM